MKLLRKRICQGKDIITFTFYSNRESYRVSKY